MELISMTDFVLEQKETIASDEITQADWYDIEAIKLEKVRNYATFLKKPLKLEMFVPVGENGEFLEEPNHLDYKNKNQYNELVFSSESNKMHYHANYDIYQKAKEKVLFEGFELKGETDESWLFSINDIFPNIIYKESIIERLLIYKSKIKLTQSAIRQFS